MFRTFSKRAKERKAERSSHRSAGNVTVESVSAQADRLRDEGRTAEALALIERHASDFPLSVEIQVRLGVLLQLERRYSESRAALENALILNPYHPAALKFLARTLNALGEHRQAIEVTRRAIDNEPSDSELLIMRGAFQLDLGSFEEAARDFHRALEINPHDIVPLLNLEILQVQFGPARKYKDIRPLTETIRAQAIGELVERLRAGTASASDANCLLVLTEYRAETFAIALEIYERFAAREDLHAEFLVNLSVVAITCGWFEAALKLRQAALASPDHPLSTRGGIGGLLVAQGGAGWFEGWQMLAERWGDYYPPNHPTEVKKWRGEELGEARLFVYSDQGSGDALIALRCVPLLADRGIRSVLWVQPGIAELAQSVRGFDELVCASRRPDPRSYGCTYARPLLELIPIMKFTAAEVSNPPVLHVPDALCAIWSERLQGTSGKRIGAIFSGNPARVDDWQRTIPIEDLRPLFVLKGLNWVNLAVDRRAESKAAIAMFDMLDPTDELNSFSDTAALMSQLDAVVTIDCAGAHVAGCLGIPVYVLVPTAIDWRWWNGSESARLWPSARIYRADSVGVFTEAVQRLAGDLAEACATGFESA